MNAKQLLSQKWKEGKLILVGLDTDPTKIPSHILEECNGDERAATLSFNIKIVNETHCCWIQN
jgi:hypothetical protein